jgi:hypothetical protein
MTSFSHDFTSTVQRQNRAKTFTSGEAFPPHQRLTFQLGPNGTRTKDETPIILNSQSMQVRAVDRLSIDLFVIFSRWCVKLF